MISPKIAGCRAFNMFAFYPSEIYVTVGQGQDKTATKSRKNETIFVAPLLVHVCAGQCLQMSRIV